MPTPRPRVAHRRVLALLLGTAVALAACSDSTTEPAPTLTTLEVRLTSATISRTGTTAAVALGRDQEGREISAGTVSWSSSAPNVASIDGSGTVTGVSAGTTQIIATAGGVTGQATLTVTQPPPVLTTVTVTLAATAVQQGASTAATAAGRDQYDAPFTIGPITWTSSETSVATIDSLGAITTLAPGTTQIRALAGGIAGVANLTVSAPPAIRVNEVESNGGTPGDWVELYNPTSAPVDVSGWQFKDNDDTRTFRIAEGTTIAAGAYLVLEEAQFDFGLGAADAARLYNRFGVLVDAYTWTSHAMTTYGRCPNGSGTFQTMASVTKGAVNDCRPQVRVNEVESSGGTPGDWIELYNAGPVLVDLSGFVVKDNDDSRTTRLPAGTTIAPGAFLVIEEATLGFGLGSADAARLFDASGTVLIDAYAWTAHATTTYGRCPDGTGGFTTTTRPTKGTANDCAGSVKINEVESNGGTPDDWIELYNAGATAVDISGYIVKDNDDSRTSRIPDGTVLAPGAFYVVEAPVIDYGLGAADAARLFDANGALVDSYSWNSHAPITYGRCPDGTGDFASTTVSTKGAANICAPVGPVAAPWPGSGTVTAVDATGQFTSNLSGLTYEGAAGGNPAVLWASLNGPGTLFRLVFSGGVWAPDATGGWANGKALRYPDGTGDVDAEGVAFAGGSSAGGMYVAAERNNSASSVSRNSVLRYDVTQAGITLQATHEWNLTANLPAVGANLGAEAITWIPDSVLVNRQFVDESRNAPYNPANYPDHAGGLFFVGLEANGVIYAFALNHTNSTFTRIATISTGFPGVMGLEYDPDTRQLWATCDDGCGGQAGVLEIETAAGSPTRGRFRAPRVFARPAGLPNVNNEGFAIAPQSECANGLKPAFWADDNATGGNSLRRGLMPCGPIAAPFRR